MTLERQNPGDVNMSVSIIKDGKKLKNDAGEYELKEFVRGFEIFESIGSATLEAKLIIQDTAGLINTLTGTELFEIRLIGSIIDRTFYMRSYSLESRSKINQDSETYIVNLVSDEFIKNECVNVFGNSRVIFNNKTETSQVVDTILTDKRFLKTRKNVYLEETLNKHEFIIPNWRPFDTIYWMTERSIRKTKTGGVLQNGFAFYENALGYHYKSLDKMIEDIRDMSETKETNYTSGQTRLYTYGYSPKSVEQTQATDQFKISTITFPDEKNFLMGLRHGAWSGFSIGFDPATISSSKMGESTDMSVDAHRYKISELWSKMSHLNTGQGNPIEKMDTSVRQLIDFPKRVRYTMLPNQIFDPKYKNQPQKNYEELVELQAYQWMRIESLKNVKLQITIPGNLDLYVGSGINIIMPTTQKSGEKPKIDERYSGRYMIASLTHSTTGAKLVTELLLMKDSSV
ncbi:hypothetical protein Sn250709_014 [Synechococcus phage S-RIM2]|jgi:hypothetical protein|uniref:Uncharacterized protein n=4 Tax=Nerrivikvirus srim2 TaxID=2734125 RepID=A0A1D7RK56_9CAUD|nr:tail protein [Synechococcus phage S-RIM2 R1_1999]AGH06703.1 hypothetical protein SWRG_00009 [Synechococcus phage S-RIM2 R21_2007]AGH06913.1 hypothetical protein SWUG_00004 [Synechococcus phage S-RIM2 R9_2006]AON97532.1 hypothetical protein Fa020709_014 [Synechococcus phage S-RIM2]AGH07123.1 hypothetical protein SWTG_00202 [Synechococcus phage S-RIM2 R1_1999]AON97746.1 hypothetical protein Fa100709_014 [Synechococcus phage S-RIM2]